jgi:hypothetical protein
MYLYSSDRLNRYSSELANCVLENIKDGSLLKDVYALHSYLFKFVLE